MAMSNTNNVINFQQQCGKLKSKTNNQTDIRANNTLCPKCGVCFRNGHWLWCRSSYLFNRFETCPACKRIDAKEPAGFLTLSGKYFKTHRTKIMLEISKIIENQMARKPMRRLMNLDEVTSQYVVLSFTDSKSARIIGQIIATHFDGQLDTHHTQITKIVRVKWEESL